MLYLVKLNGQICAILPRTPAVTSKCVLTPATKSGRWIADRTDYWDGLIPSDVAINSGEVVETVSATNNRSIIVMSIIDDMRGVTHFLGARANLSLDWRQQSTSVDENFNVVTTWPLVSADVSAFGELVTAQLRQEDPGLLSTTKYLIFVPATYNVRAMDRVVFSAISCQVDSLDNIILDGIVRLQCSDDTRV